jgi:hypothetical protein
MAEMLDLPAVRPDTALPDPAPAPRRRIILMSGMWCAPTSRFAFEATVFVGANGAAEGDFFWLNRGSFHAPPDLSGGEMVRGSARADSLELVGYRTDTPLLACDHYKITLHGAPDAGLCSGVSFHHGDWDGRLEGVYRVVEQDG